MKKQIVKEYVVVKKVRYLPRPPPPPPPPIKRRILVVGSCMLTIVTICPTHPVSGEEMRNAKGCIERGGKASELCSVLRRFGQPVELLALLSSAQGYESITNDLCGNNIDISNCPRTLQPPPLQALITVAGTDIKTKIESPCRYNELTYQHFRGAVDFKNYYWIHFESRNPSQTLRMMRAVHAYNERVPDSKITVSTDLPNLHTMSVLLACQADFVFVERQLKDNYAYMNVHETVWKVRDMLNTVHAKWQAKQRKKMPYLLPDEPPVDEEPCERQPEAPVIIYSNYKEGSSCLLADNTYIKVPGCKPTAMVNTIAESGTFIGSVIYAYSAAKMSLRDAIEYGTRVTSAKLSMPNLDGLRGIPKDLNGFGKC